MGWGERGGGGGAGRGVGGGFGGGACSDNLYTSGPRPRRILYYLHTNSGQSPPKSKESSAARCAPRKVKPGESAESVTYVMLCLEINRVEG